MIGSERIRDSFSLIQIEKLIKKLKFKEFRISKPEDDSFIYIEIEDGNSYLPLCFIDSCYSRAGDYYVELLNLDNLSLKNYNKEIREICNSL